MSKKNDFNTYGLLGLIFIIVMALDTITKFLSEKYLTSKITLLPFLHLQYVTNTGAAFGLFRGGHIWLGVLGAVVFFLILSIIISGVRKKSLQKIEIILLTILEAGIIGNLIDRLFRGYVVDFIMLPYWPVFNIADMAISISIGLYVLIEIINTIKKKN